MPQDILMPSFAAGMEEGSLARWLKKEGDLVTRGDVIAEIETDKATMEVEAPASGVLGRILVADGTPGVAVNTAIAVLLAVEEAASLAIEPLPRTEALRPAPGDAPAAAEERPVGLPPAKVASPHGKRVWASPLARRLAEQHCVDLRSLTGSGPNGRIVQIDVERAHAKIVSPPAVSALAEPVAAAPAVTPTAPVGLGLGPYTAVPHSTMRQVIARRLLEAKTTIPHFYLQVDCEIDELLAIRSDLNADARTGLKLSVNDLVIKAAALALRQVPAVNVVWTQDALLRLHDVDISVAVAIDGGLVTPIVRKADQKGLGAISAQVKDLAARARKGKLTREEYQGGGFCISNLGMYDVREFAAIINSPQSCILAVGAAERRPVVKGDSIVPATVMSCTLSVDHRAVDGALGAEFLAAFKAIIERPMRLLL